ncbi:MAG: phosphoribosylanthranilate isomerase [Lachnospiraceae bacterium]|nr:phosphoribosylanthranilate isomerase [Lachnospiraceae bacterium]
MTRIKLCGLTRECDIEAANELAPDYIGFVFAKKSRRCLSPERAAELMRLLDPSITAVGVFVNEAPETVAGLLNRGIINIAQLHGGEDERYIRHLRSLTDKPLIQAFRMDTADDIAPAVSSPADYILLDSGTGGTGTPFDWRLTEKIARPYFLAGGLDAGNVGAAVSFLRPYAVDVSSGIETDGLKDKLKMTEFVRAVRGAAGRIE